MTTQTAFRVEQQPPVNTDARLQKSRRIDWRFLLPDPSLGHVAYAGNTCESLIEALTLFSESLTRIETTAPVTQVDSGYDGVVIKETASDDVLRRCTTLLKPGGFLYIELRQARADRLLRRLQPGKVLTAIERLGYTDGQAHWHWPDFERCTRFIPLDQTAPLMFDLSRNDEGILANAKSRLGYVLARSGVVARFAPCVSITARWGRA